MNGRTEQRTTNERASALALLLNALVEAVAAGGAEGVPGGTLYAALMQQGCSLQQFDSFMSILVDAGRVRKDGHVYRVVDENFSGGACGM